MPGAIARSSLHVIVFAFPARQRPSTLTCSERNTHPSLSYATLPYARDPVSRIYDRRRRAANARQAGDNMDTNTLLIILVVLLVLGGGGFFYRRRV